MGSTFPQSDACSRSPVASSAEEICDVKPIVPRLQNAATENRDRAFIQAFRNGSVLLAFHRAKNDVIFHCLECTNKYTDADTCYQTTEWRHLTHIGVDKFAYRRQSNSDARPPDGRCVAVVLTIDGPHGWWMIDNRPMLQWGISVDVQQLRTVC
jgi:hypothetical protein